MSPSKSPTEENRTIEEMTGEECYELISEPVWDILWCLIIGLHSLVLGNIIYKVRSDVSIYNICHNNILIIGADNAELERSR